MLRNFLYTTNFKLYQQGGVVNVNESNSFRQPLGIQGSLAQSRVINNNDVFNGIQLNNRSIENFGNGVNQLVASKQRQDQLDLQQAQVGMAFAEKAYEKLSAGVNANMDGQTGLYSGVYGDDIIKNRKIAEDARALSTQLFMSGDYEGATQVVNGARKSLLGDRNSQIAVENSTMLQHLANIRAGNVKPGAGEAIDRAGAANALSSYESWLKQPGNKYKSVDEYLQTPDGKKHRDNIFGSFKYDKKSAMTDVDLIIKSNSADQLLEAYQIAAADNPNLVKSFEALQDGSPVTTQQKADLLLSSNKTRAYLRENGIDKFNINAYIEGREKAFQNNVANAGLKDFTDFAVKQNPELLEVDINGQTQTVTRNTAERALLQDQAAQDSIDSIRERGANRATGSGGSSSSQQPLFKASETEAASRYYGLTSRGIDIKPNEARFLEGLSNDRVATILGEYKDLKNSGKTDKEIQDTLFKKYKSLDSSQLGIISDIAGRPALSRSTTSTQPPRVAINPSVVSSSTNTTITEQDYNTSVDKGLLSRSNSRNISQNSGTNTASLYVEKNLPQNKQNQFLDLVEEAYSTNSQLNKSNPDHYFIAMDFALSEMVGSGDVSEDILTEYRALDDEIGRQGLKNNLSFSFKPNQKDNSISDASPFTISALRRIETELLPNLNINPSDLVITSIKRTKEQNDAVGAKGENHLTGDAVDIRTSNDAGKQLQQFINTPEGKAYFESLGIEPIDEGDHIHLQPIKGVSPTPAQEAAAETTPNLSKKTQSGFSKLK